LSTPSAEEAVRRDLAEQIAQFVDTEFLRLNNSGGATFPASITNGADSISADGVNGEALYSDLNRAFATFDTANLSTASLHFIMPMALARGIATLRNALGQFDFSGMTPMG